MSLLADITRCHDTGCPEREQCRRWLERDSGTVHAASLFPYDEDIGSRCSLRIPPITTETMNTPITPPPELVQQWTELPLSQEEQLVVAARWGADAELEACWNSAMQTQESFSASPAAPSRRRPKPPNLKAQALAALSRADKDALINPRTGEVVALRTILRKEQADTIRRALEALDD